MRARDADRGEEVAQIVREDVEVVGVLGGIGPVGRAEPARLPGEQPVTLEVRPDEVELEVAGRPAAEQEERLAVAAGVVEPERERSGVDEPPELEPDPLLSPVGVAHATPVRSCHGTYSSRFDASYRRHGTSTSRGISPRGRPSATATANAAIAASPAASGLDSYVTVTVPASIASIASCVPLIPTTIAVRPAARRARPAPIALGSLKHQIASSSGFRSSSTRTIASAGSARSPRFSTSATTSSPWAAAASRNEDARNASV